MNDQLSLLPMLDDAEHPTWLLNNAVSNLEWVSTRENQIHAKNNGLETKCKINMDIAKMIRKDKGSHAELSKKYGLCKTEIGLIRQNKRWVA